ncbi:MAG: VanZ family protein [Verrucomicrobiaceae bacterium]|nr:MAG: VanZ family protein [Verrucomicrobiaceae bacterium]
MKIKGSPVSSRNRVLLALGGLVLLLLVPLPRPAEPDPIMENFRNLLHVPVFMAVTLLLRVLQRSISLRLRSIWICAGAAALLGVLSEILQALTGRTPSVGDLGADLAGILLACALMQRRGAPLLVIRRAMLLLAGGGMFALAAYPLVTEVSVFMAKREAFPVLMDRYALGNVWQEQGGTHLRVVGPKPRGLEVETAQGDHEGLRYVVPRGVDAGGYSGLVIETINECEAFELGVRIDVTTGKRKNAGVTVPRGKAVLKVGWTPETGDGELRRVVLFTGLDQPARRFRLVVVRLVRSQQE